MQEGPIAVPELHYIGQVFARSLLAQPPLHVHATLPVTVYAGIYVCGMDLTLRSTKFFCSLTPEKQISGFQCADFQ